MGGRHIRNNRIISDKVFLTQLGQLCVVIAENRFENGVGVLTQTGCAAPDLARGAGILLNPKNLLEEWGIETNVLCRNTEIKNEKNKKVLESTDDLVYSCVGLYPKNVDQIAQESRVEIRKLMSILVTLELQGYIREITKNYYIRIK